MRKKVHYARGLKLKYVTAEEIPRCEEIGGRAFRQHTAGWYPEKRSVCLEDRDGETVSCLLFTPMPGWWGAAKVPMCAVGNVATNPDLHRKGYAGALMVESIHLMREEGYAVSPLWPFSFRYYDKFGWSLGALDLLLKAPPSQLRGMGNGKRVRAAKAGDLSAVRDAYRRFARRHNGCTVRPKKWWTEIKKPAFPRQYLVHRNPEGRIDGYLRYHPFDRHGEDGKRVSVAELAADSVAAEGDLAAGLADLPDVTRAEILLPADSLLPHFAEERVEMRKEQRLQIRVLDPLRALCCLKPPKGLEGRLSYLVDDWVIDSKRPVPVGVEIASGRVTARKRKPASGIRCDINTFTQLFTGTISAKDAAMLGRLEAPRGSDLELSDRLLFGRTPFRSNEEPG
jgi:predicted acetyltransferase